MASNAPGRLRLHAAVELLPVAIGRLLSRARQTSLATGLYLVEELLSGAQLTDDRFGSVALAFHGASPCQVWPVEKLS